MDARTDISLGTTDPTILSTESSFKVSETPRPIDYTPLITAIVTMCIPGVTINSLALYCIIPDLRSKKTQVKQLLLALCTVDFCGCWGILILIITGVVDDVSIAVCSLASFVTVYFSIVSGAVATFMAAERCLALRAPYWYQENAFTWKFWSPFATVIVLITVVCLFPEMGLGDVTREFEYNNVTYISCGSFPDTPAATVRESVFTVTYGTVGLALVTANLTFNAQVLKTVHRMNKRILPSTRTQSKSEEFEMTKMLLALSATFLICWMPLNVSLICIQLRAGSPGRTVNLLISTLVGVNFLVDPIIYLRMNSKYKEKIKQLFTCKRNMYNREKQTRSNRAANSTDESRLTTKGTQNINVYPS